MLTPTHAVKRHVEASAASGERVGGPLGALTYQGRQSVLLCGPNVLMAEHTLRGVRPFGGAVAASAGTARQRPQDSAVTTNLPRLRPQRRHSPNQSDNSDLS